MSSQISTASHCLIVEGELGIYGAAAAKEPLFEALHAIGRPMGAAIHLDLAAVTELDTAGLQLLLLARREAAKAQRRLGIAAASEAVSEVLDLCGLRAALATPAGAEPRS